MINYDEKIRKVVSSPNISGKSYLALISNSKFTIYKVSTTEQSEDDIAIMSSKIWEVYFSSISDGIGRLITLDFGTSDECFLSGSSNGAVALWDLKARKLKRIVAREDNSVDHVRLLDQGCVICTSFPELFLYSFFSIPKKQIPLSKPMGQCLSLHVDRTQTFALALFSCDSQLAFISLSEASIVRVIRNLGE